MAVGLPSWQSLIDHLLDDLNLERNVIEGMHGGYQMLAEYYRLKRGGIGPLRSWLDRNWRIDPNRIAASQLHRLIVELDFPTIYTTNYDRNLGTAFEVSGKAYAKISNAKEIASAPAGVTQIIKFHGDFDDDDSLVLTETAFLNRLAFDSPVAEVSGYSDPTCDRAAGGRFRNRALAHRFAASATAQPPRRALPDDDARTAREGELARYGPSRSPRRPIPPLVGQGSYLAFLGSLTAEKGPERAIRIARAAGMQVRIGAKLPRGERRYFKERLEPQIDGTQIRVIGEVNDEAKQPFLAGAAALLFPIDWPEPFGLVMIEAMACGTPVIAFRSGSVPEVIDEGVTGFVVDDEEQAVQAVKRLGELDRRGVRERFEERFTAGRMAADYVSHYQSMVNAGGV
jgi:glycosyltransferase involved in cell wall biosynthesis